MRHEIALGSKTDQAVNAVWAAMIYHTPALSNSLKAYGNTQLQLMIIQHLFYIVLLFFLAKFFINALVNGNISLCCPVDQECKSCLSDDFVQVYVLADSIRTWMVSVSNIVNCVIMIK